MQDLFAMLEDLCLCKTCGAKVASVDMYGMCDDCADKAQEYAHEAKEEAIGEVMEREGVDREEAIEILRDR